jgi:hypothetical protein
VTVPPADATKAPMRSTRGAPAGSPLRPQRRLSRTRRLKLTRRPPRTRRLNLTWRPRVLRALQCVDHGHGPSGFAVAASQGHGGGSSSSTPMYAFRAMDLNAATGWPQMPSYAAFINSGQLMHGMPPPFLIPGPSSSSDPMPGFLGPPGVPAPAFNCGVPSATAGGEGSAPPFQGRRTQRGTGYLQPIAGDSTPAVATV